MKKTILKTNILFSIMFVILIGLDQFTKKLAFSNLVKEDSELITNVLSLHYLENRGAAWGIFENAIWLFSIIAVIVIFLMIYFYSKIPFTKRFIFLRFTIILLSAGAIGNFIDRIFNGYVIDFIYFKLINFPVFNVADIYVCVAAAFLVIALIFVYKEDELSFFSIRSRKKEKENEEKESK